MEEIKKIDEEILELNIQMIDIEIKRNELFSEKLNKQISKFALDEETKNMFIQQIEHIKEKNMLIETNKGLLLRDFETIHGHPYSKS